MSFRSRIFAWYDSLLGGFAALVGVALLCTVFLVTADVAGRFFFRQPIGWVFEATEHILMSVPFLGMAWLVRHAGGHVRIDLLVKTFPDHWQARAEVLSSALCAGACATATFFAVATAWDHYVRGIMTYGIYPVPKYLLVGIIAFGFILATIEFIRSGAEHYVALKRSGAER